MAAKATGPCPLWVKRVTSVRSRRSRNVRYASNIDEIDASQQNVARCHEPTYAVQQKRPHLVGSDLQSLRYCYPERLGGGPAAAASKA
jgi:hypothetical protein